MLGTWQRAAEIRRTIEPADYGRGGGSAERADSQPRNREVS